MNKTIENRMLLLRNFEDLGRSFKRGIGTALIAASVLAASCGDDKPGPSKYCCEAKKCDEKTDTTDPYGSKYVCDGELDDCYCRPKSCCEKLSCGSDENCLSGQGGCFCQPRPSTYDG